jgi:phosphoribosylformylglycinamidine (FGAM) synthase-like enzyme
VGGNHSGIPTVQGAMYFDVSYSGKPLVFVGSLGVLPRQLPSGANSAFKKILPGDRIIMVGGAIGRDGIHGANFSSLSLEETALATFVQSGDPLTQKRLHDFLLYARDQEWYHAITDNGAGGLSSSIGEMALEGNGAFVDLTSCPVKYSGLAPYELMISESQERMTLAVPPKYRDVLLRVAKAYGILAVDLGYFENTGFLQIEYERRCVALLDLAFLRDTPRLKLKAYWEGSCTREFWSQDLVEAFLPRLSLEAFEVLTCEGAYGDILETLLKAPNIASKQKWVSSYDQEVQGATHLKPYTGKTGEGPSDSAVLWLYPHGGSEDSGIVVGGGFAPRISLKDPYLMAYYAVDEAVRNVVASGGDPRVCCLLDNFCWPDPVSSSQNPHGSYHLGQLVRACQGLFDICKQYRLPLVSGKDSMKNDFRGKNPQGQSLYIRVLPTLWITAITRVSLEHTLSTDFKSAGALLYLLGESIPSSSTPLYGLAGSELLEWYDLGRTPLALSESTTLPAPKWEAHPMRYERYYQACQKDLLLSGHDLSEGGFLVALVESMIGGDLGACVELPSSLSSFTLLSFLFNETPGRFLVSVAPEQQEAFESHFQGEAFFQVGRVSCEPSLVLKQGGRIREEKRLSLLRQAWKGTKE